VEKFSWSCYTGHNDDAEDIQARGIKHNVNIGIIGGADGPTSIFFSSTLSVEPILFVIILSLLIVHEMDAIRAKEWKMFLVLKDMAEETAYRVFVLIHIPLYLFAFAVLFYDGAVVSYVLKVVIDVFLLGHAIIHYGFRKHSNNGFQSRFSKIIIYSMPVFALLHLCLLLMF
jgi:hypothetical protein